MPELPDVAVFERRIAKGALDRRITDVDVSDAGMVTGLPASRLETTLEGQRFTDTHRHEKWCLVQVEDELQHGTVAQRSTWWCPQDQPEF